MFATLENVLLMDKETKLDKENKQVNFFICYQRGNKSLIAVKNIPHDLYESVEIEDRISLKVKLVSWAQGNNHGLSVQYIDVVK